MRPTTSFRCPIVDSSWKSLGNVSVHSANSWSSLGPNFLTWACKEPGEQPCLVMGLRRGGATSAPPQPLPACPLPRAGVPRCHWRWLWPRGLGCVPFLGWGPGNRDGTRGWGAEGDRHTFGVGSSQFCLLGITYPFLWGHHLSLPWVPHNSQSVDLRRS